MKKNKIGIIGLGVGERVLKSIFNSKFLKVLKVCDLNKIKLSKIKKKYKNIKVTSNANEIIEDKDIDLVYIASYDKYHYDQVIGCLLNKKKIFVEKPICQTFNQLKKIEKIALKNKVYIESNFVLNVNPLFINLKKEINKSKNKLYSIEADYLWGRSKKLIGWRSKDKKYSLILGGAIHMIDLVCWLLDDYPVSVYCSGNNIAMKESTFKKKSFYQLILNFKNHLSVKISVNSSSNTEHFHDLRVYHKNYTFYHNPLGTYTYTNKKKLKKISGAYPDNKSKINMFLNYIKNINLKSSKYICNKKLFNVMRVCFKAIESSKLNRVIKIKYE